MKANVFCCIAAALIASVAWGGVAGATSLDIDAVDPAPAGSPPLLHAIDGVTAIAGRVLTTDGTPLSSVVIADGKARTATDEAGRFLLQNLPDGEAVLILDGRSAHPAPSSEATDYGYYEVRVSVHAGVTNELPYTSWLPRIDHAHDVAIDTPTTQPVIVRAATIPGLEVRIPSGAVITDPDGKLVTHVGITPIPLHRTPFPLPRNVAVPVYFTAQPGGSTITSADGSWLGAQVVYPNYHHDLPGARGTFWKYDPDRLGWAPYGTGTVQADATQVVPDQGTRIYALTGAMFEAGNTPPAAAPDPPPPDKNPGDGDPVDLSTGLFVQTQTDLAVNDVLPLAVTRTYRPGDYNQRSFGVGMTLPYDMYIWSALQYQQCDVILPNGGRIHYTRVINPANPTDNNYADAVFVTTAPGAFYNSHIYWRSSASASNVGWDLVRQDGSVLHFGEVAPLQSISDRFGNTITITRTNGQTGNIVQVSSPNGRSIAFGYDSSGRINRAADNIGRIVAYTYDSSGRMSTVTDPDGGVTTYTWDSSNRIQSIQDARKNRIFTNTFDSNDRVIKQTLPDGTFYQFTYTLNAAGGVAETDVTDPRGSVRKVTFNSAQYRLTDKRAVGKPQEIDYTYTRDPVSNYALSLLDGLGRTTSWVYDANGNLTSQTQLAGTANAVTTSYTYSPNYNQLTSITDPLSHTPRSSAIRWARRFRLPTRSST